jgi:REP element-mobilizing transposase RayT
MEHALRRKRGFLSLYDILGFGLMDNHFHLLVKMASDTGLSDDDIEKRLKQLYGLY